MLDFIFYGVVGFALAIVLWELVRHYRNKIVFAVLAAFVLLMPTLAFADNIAGSGPLLAAIDSDLPATIGRVFANLMAVLGMLSVVSSVFRGYIQPPSNTAPKWWITTYRIASIPALDFGFARNVVLPGQTAAVQETMAIVAKLAATNPSSADLNRSDASNVVTLPR